MTAQLIRLDDHRRSVAEWMRCLFCNRLFWSKHVRDERPTKYFGGCPGCDEEASLPAWRVDSWS